MARPPPLSMAQEMDLSRRKFVHLGTTSLIPLVQSGQLQLDSGITQRDDFDFQGAADWIGPASARPAPDDPVFDNQLYYAYRYVEEDTGLQYFLTQDDDAWQEMPTGIHTYDSSSLPTPTNSGYLAFDSDRGTLTWWDRDHWEIPTFVDDVETSDDQVTNTTTETEILRFAINPGALITGRVFILRNFGVYDTAASDDNFQYRVYIGDSGFDPVAGEGTVFANLSTVQENVSDGPWQAKTTTVVDAEGSTGVVDTHTEARFNNTPNDDHSRNVTVDTTTASEVVATIEWNNAKAGNVARQDMSYLQQQS